MHLQEKELEECMNSGKCVIGSSLEEVKLLIDQMKPSESGSIIKNLEMVSPQRKV